MALTGKVIPPPKAEPTYEIGGLTRYDMEVLALALGYISESRSYFGHTSGKARELQQFVSNLLSGPPEKK